MHHYDAYDLVSDAYRNHLGVIGGVMFNVVIEARLKEIAEGAEKKDPAKLKAVLETVKKKCPQYTSSWLFLSVEQLVQAEEGL